MSTNVSTTFATNGKWNTSDYRNRKAERLASTKAEWVTNPETGETFCLRRVGVMAPMVAGHMPAVLTAEAIKGWEEEGVHGINGELKPSNEQIDDAQRDIQIIARVVSQTCVVPKLVQPATKEDELDPAELDDKDLMFIFRWATGQVGSVRLKGGTAMNMADLKSLRKKPRKRVRAGNNSKELQSGS